MVGVTYSHFKKDELCLIVIDSSPREYLLGRFAGQLDPAHPAWNKVRQDSPNAMAVNATIIDPRVQSKHPVEGLVFGQAPMGNYAVLHYIRGKEHIRRNEPHYLDQLSLLERAADYQLLRR